MSDDSTSDRSESPVTTAVSVSAAATAARSSVWSSPSRPPPDANSNIVASVLHTRDLRIIFLRSNRISNRIGRIYHALYSEYLIHSIGI